MGIMDGAGAAALAIATVLAVVPATAWADDADLKGISYHVVPKDAIPALLLPKHVAPDKVDYLRNDDRIIAVRYNGFDLAYPTRILDHHEIVNDLIGGAPILVTYCPLCGSAAAFVPVIDRKLYVFGVSGSLYQSDLLMYDHETDSLWVQLTGTAIEGKAKSMRLPSYPVAYDTWAHWKSMHPNGEVLAIPERWAERFGDYRVGPYMGYDSTQQLWYFVSHLDERLPNKTRVVGVEAEGFYKAYPEALLQTTRVIHDKVGSIPIALVVDRDAARIGAFPEARHHFAFANGRVKDEAGNAWDWRGNALVRGNERIESFAIVPTYWFAWGAIHPKTDIYSQP